MLKASRRDFLRTSIAGVTLSASDILLGPVAGISQMALAQTSAGISNARASGPLIIVFQRGAADGLAILSPLDDENFNAARPPEMRFNASEASGTVTVGQTQLYWHPSAQALAKLYNTAQLAVWPAVGILNETRSHFEAQEMMERGVNSLNSLPDNLVWLTRQLDQSKSSRLTSATSLFAGSTNVPRSMQGAQSAIAIRDLQNGVNIPSGLAGQNILTALCATDRKQPAASLMQVHVESMAQLNRALPKTSDNKVAPYQSAGQTPYPNNDPGVGLRSVARMIEARVGMQYAWVDQTGWDTHEGQPGRLKGVINNLSLALEAFAQDMQARHQPYTLIVMTEFGRRLRSNRSNGTDHGHGSLALILGDRVPGGKSYGSWPSLNEKALDRGVDLAVTTDYQKMIAQAMAWHTS